jgi:hypothetical protein
MRCPRALALSPLLCLLAASAPQNPGDVLIVTRKTTKLRAQKRTFAPAVADLKEGDQLDFVSKDGAWLMAKFAGNEGFVHETDVSKNKEVRLSGQGVRETYSTSETSAARKGFNPQVEQSYRNGHPDLEKAFQLVDQLQARTVAEAELRSFLAAGKLLPEGQ